MTTSADELARRLTALEAKSGTKATQLAYSTLEAGAITVVDEYDALKGGIGVQFDGAVLAQEVNGPAPLTPTTPTLAGGPGTLSVRWDGLWADGDVVPSNFTRVEIHIQKDAEPVGDVAATIYGTFETPRGGEQSFSLGPGTYFVALVARNLSGARGPRGLAASAVVEAVVSDADLAAIDQAVTDAQAAADAANAAVEGVPAQIATAKQEAIDAAALDAQDAADLAQANAIAAAATDATSKADAAKTDAINTAATTAQAKADAAQAAAIAAAATDAQTKASAAQTAAINAAATDATTKANNAQTAAVGLAATDATTKSDLALAKALAADSKVNNVTRTGTTTGWTITSGAGAGSAIVVEDKDFNGVTLKAMKISSNTDTQVVSDYFDIDPTKAYEVRMWVLDPTEVSVATALQFYAGWTSINPALSIRSIFPVTDATGAVGAGDANPYFYSTRDATATWREHVHYIMPTGAAADDMKNLTKPSNAAAGTGGWSRSYQLTPDSTRGRVRILNWANAGTSRDLWVANVTVREMALADVRAASLTQSWRTAGAATIEGGQITASSIIAGKLAASAVVAGNIATDAVTAGTVAAGAITTAKLAAGAVTANEIAANAVTTAKILAGNVTATEIATDAITAVKIQADAVTAVKIATDAVLARNIKAGEVVAGKLTTGSVIAGNIAADAVTANTIAADAVTATKILAGSVIAGKLAANAVVASNIASFAIQTQHLAIGDMLNQTPNGAGELGIGTVGLGAGLAGVTFDTTDKPAEIAGVWRGSPTTSTVNVLGSDWINVEPGEQLYFEHWAKADIAGTKMYVEVRDQAGALPAATAFTPLAGENSSNSGAYAMNNLTLQTVWTKYGMTYTTPATGVSRIRVTRIYYNHTNGTQGSTQSYALRIRRRAAGKLIVDGTITAGKMAADSIATASLQADAVSAVKLAADAVLARNIKAGEVVAGKLTTGSVIAGNIAADAVTATTIAAGAIVAGKLNTGAVVAGNIATDAVTAGTIAANAVTTTTINADAVTAVKIAVDAVLARNVKAGEIVAGKLAADAVIAGNIAANAVTAGTIAANAITADKIDANALTGKTVTGGVVRTAATGARMAMRPGVSSINYGQGIFEIFSGNSSELYPAEIYTIADGPNPGDNISLYISAPGKTGFPVSKRGFIQLHAKDADTASAVAIHAEVPRLEAETYAEMAAGPAAPVTPNNYIRTYSDGKHYIVSGGVSQMNVDSTGVAVDNLKVSNLGVTIASAGSNTYTTTGAYDNVVPGAAGASIVFTAPLSGRVKVVVGGFTGVATAGQYVQLGYELRSGGTVGSGTVVHARQVDRSIGNYNDRIVAGERTGWVGGLTPGATYNVRLMLLAQAAGAIVSAASLTVEPML